MPKLVTILVIGLIFEAVGVVFLSKGLKQIGEASQITVSEVTRLIGRGIANPNILLGVAFEAAFFGTLLYLMSRGDVSFVWPLTSLGFVLTTLAAKFILHENVSVLRWGGVLLIVAGAALITYSEKLEPKKSTPPAAQSLEQR
ncbi:MAG TPA: EamA family transporter [Verrucomicrobiae bacterium]|nr:EamA family transporter [Verrucomicrobiae bacterium]